MKKEIWKFVLGYEGLYEVSNKGRVRLSCNRCKRWKKGHILKPSMNCKGYPFVTLSKKNYRKKYAIHRLVLDAFISLRPKKLQCRHLNDNPKDKTTILRI